MNDSIYITPSQDIRIDGIDLMDLLELAKNNDNEGLKDMLKELGIEYK